MNKKSLGVLSSLLLKRSNAIEFVAVTFVSAFAISILASSITLVQGFKASVGIYVGFILFAIVLLYFILKIYRNLSNTKVITGFIVRDEKENSILKIARYPFSNEIAEYLNAAFAESPDIKAIWEREPLKIRSMEDHVKWSNNRSRQLVHEAVEYFVIEELSTHLSSYFNNETFEKDNIREIGRNDIPEILYENRFLQLFSKPMEERAAFERNIQRENNEKKQVNDKEEFIIDGKKVTFTRGETVMSSGSNGAIYQRFDLVLSLNTKVKRLDKHSISIETERFNLNIKTVVDGQASLPEGFMKYYLQKESMDYFFNVFEIKLVINIRFKVKNFFLKHRLEYFRWIDSFLERLNSRFSKDVFFEKLNWENAFTVLQFLKQSYPVTEKNESICTNSVQDNEQETINS
ncbi:hypothetical protein [Bacillus sp. 1A]|uniref:hypothetical protein n=1 Tax=Bacillus sp. 1A TaxID=3461399 RepID=UPI0040445E8D